MKEIVWKDIKEFRYGRKNLCFWVFLNRKTGDVYFDIKHLGMSCQLCLYDGTPHFTVPVGSKNGEKRIFVNLNWLCDEWIPGFKDSDTDKYGNLVRSFRERRKFYKENWKLLAKDLPPLKLERTYHSFVKGGNLHT